MRAAENQEILRKNPGGAGPSGSWCLGFLGLPCPAVFHTGAGATSWGNWEFPIPLGLRALGTEDRTVTTKIQEAPPITKLSLRSCQLKGILAPPFW